MPTLSITNSFADGNVLTAAQLNTNYNDIKTFVNTTKLDADNIQAGVITNALVSASAAIAVSKLAAGASTQVLLNTAAPTPTWTTLSGDVTVGATGVTAVGASKVTSAMILDGEIVNADISASAAITYSKLSIASGDIAFAKLATLTSGNVLVGSAGNVPTSVAMSGDVTIIASGATTIANDAVTAKKATFPQSATGYLSTSHSWPDATYKDLTLNSGASAPSIVLAETQRVLVTFGVSFYGSVTAFGAQIKVQRDKDGGGYTDFSAGELVYKQTPYATGNSGISNATPTGCAATSFIVELAAGTWTFKLHGQPLVNFATINYTGNLSVAVIPV